MKLGPLPLGLAVVSGWLLVRLLLLGFGRVDIDDSGIRVRRLMGVRALAWVDVWKVDVVTTPFGRHVSLGAQGWSFRLPVPITSWVLPDGTFDKQVDGIRDWCVARAAPRVRPVDREWRRRWVYPVLVFLLAASAVAFDRPWGWVAGPEASEVPDPCVVAQAEAGALGATAAEATSPPGVPAGARACQWTMTSTARLLAVQYMLYHRSGVHSATAMAKAAPLSRLFGVDLRPEAEVRQAPHLGDESRFSYISHPLDLNRPIGMLVLARRANVVVTVYLGAELPLGSRPEVDVRYEDVQPTAALAQSLLTALELR
jgi:hypothetical protein